jgi:hypothetical protein
MAEPGINPLRDTSFGDIRVDKEKKTPKIH